MKLYISGPMTGAPALNEAAFVAAARRLRADGFDVVSPIEIDHPGQTAPGSLPWVDYLRRDLQAMLDCDGIVLLPGWRDSRGARLELLTAVHLHFALFMFDGSRRPALVAVDRPRVPFAAEHGFAYECTDCGDVFDSLEGFNEHRSWVHD